MSAVAPKNPLKKQEFKQFIKIIKSNKVGSWLEVAEALGVDQDTITAWKATPEAMKARADAIADALDNMERVGKNDWRMWEAKLKMLGVNPPQRHDIRRVDLVGRILAGYGLTEGEDARQVTDVEEETPQNSS